jgi:hypothetical protein
MINYHKLYKGIKVAKVWKNDKIRIVSEKRKKKEEKLESKILIESIYQQFQI